LPKCKDCGYSRRQIVPGQGLCFAERGEMGVEEAASGIESSIVPGKQINLGDEACERFVPKTSRKQAIREGN